MGEGKINLGSGSYVSSFSKIKSTKGCTITIGDNCRIANNFFCHTQSLINPGNITIGNHCFIGAYVFIREGITIGDNCIIGAHSVVTKDIPANSVAVGSPAQVIKKVS
ncbi:MAG: acyltransferase [Clostridiales bacterium]|jgi:acetyltransferase-like isoleucine patch superfamily enzyme|nr:acyltransferase [Clostridiales bacterium]